MTKVMTPERLEQLRSWLSTAYPPVIYGELLAEIDRLRAELATAVAAERKRCAGIAASEPDKHDSSDVIAVCNHIAWEIEHPAKEGGSNGH